MKICVKGLFIFLTIILPHHNIAASQIKSVVPNIATVQEALFNVRKIIINFPTGDSVAAQAYEKAQSMLLVKCAKVLCDNARIQILNALQEIDKRIAYWRYQKSHPWNYFLAKNPLKWFTGQNQDIEIENHLEQLQSHQGELYVLLGQLAEHGNVYDREYKMVFLVDYAKAYAWIDGLLDLLPRIKIAVQNVADISLFVARATQLKLKLMKVRNFKNDILSEMQETQIPTHIARNWLKYAVLIYLFGQGYSRADQISDFASTSFGRTKDYVIDIAGNVKGVFFPGKIGREGLMVQQGNIDAARSAMVNFLDRVQKDNIINAQEKKTIIDDALKGSSEEFQRFMNEKIMSSHRNQFWYAFEGWSIFTQVFGFYGGGHIEKEISGLRNIALLAPAALMGWIGYRGLSNVYQRFVTLDYTAIRRALVEINSLFVDQTKPLDDERYGKMIYLVYNLKQRAEKDVPLIDRADFIEDLDNIESKIFDVAAKRRIVDDMFRKYSFLRLV